MKKSYRILGYYYGQTFALNIFCDICAMQVKSSEVIRVKNAYIRTDLI